MERVGEGGLVAEYYNTQLMEGRIKLKGKSGGVSFVLSFVSTEDEQASEKQHFLTRSMVRSAGFPFGMTYLS